MKIPLSVPEIRGNEWKYVKECLDTNWVSSAGQYVTRFEKAVSEFVGAPAAVGCTNGTAALHLALLVSGIGVNDEVIMPSLTFAAPAFAVRYVGAWPVFLDVDPNTWQLDVAAVDRFVKSRCETRAGALVNLGSGRRIRAILSVDILGHPVDMDPLMELAHRYGLVVIEDASESLGASYNGRAVGMLGHIGCLSFNGNKIITTGGGGMLVTAKKEWADRARYLSTQAKDDPVEYIHEAIGYNYRLTNVEAAIGVAQMERLPEYVATKRRIASRYREAFSTIPGITFMPEAPWAASTFWLSTVRIDSTCFGMDSRSLMRHLAERGIESRPLWHPLHTLSPFRQCESYEVSVVDRLWEQCLSIPCSVGLRQEDQASVIAEIRGACSSKSLLL